MSSPKSETDGNVGFFAAEANIGDDEDAHVEVEVKKGLHRWESNVLLATDRNNVFFVILFVHHYLDFPLSSIMSILTS